MTDDILPPNWFKGLDPEDHEAAREFEAQLREALKKDIGTAYVITGGEYSAYQIYRVCRTKKAAEKWIEANGGGNAPADDKPYQIEEWPMDDDGYFYGPRFTMNWDLRRFPDAFLSKTGDLSPLGRKMETEDVVDGWAKDSFLPNHRVRFGPGLWFDYRGIRPPDIEVMGGVQNISPVDGTLPSMVNVTGYDEDRVRKVLADEIAVLRAAWIERGI